MKNNKPQPRNSSTNTRALSTRISAIEREMTPVIKMNGTMIALGSTPSAVTQVLRKKFRIPLSSDVLTGLDVTGSSLKLPDGARILSARFILLNGRKLRVTSYPDALQIGTDAAAPKSAMTRERIAPYSKFPSITVDIPDTISRSIDSAGSTVLFNIVGQQLNSGTSYSVDCIVSIVWEAKLY